MRCGTTTASALFNEIGDIDAETRSEAGLYRGGVRHLSRLTLTIARLRPLLLAATPRDDNVLLTMNLTNPDVRGEGGRVDAAARHAAHHALALHLGEACATR